MNTSQGLLIVGILVIGGGLAYYFSTKIKKVDGNSTQILSNITKQDKENRVSINKV